MRLIDADALKSALEIELYNDYSDLLRTERIIDNAPIVERPHGKIITDEDGNTSCSECGQTSVFGNFCYNCGADMRKGEAE